jgi:small subunit ribosomal protein S9
MVKKKTDLKKTTKAKKTVKKKTVKEKKAVQLKPVIKTKEKYFEAVGRRKTSIARTRLFLNSKQEIPFLVNQKPLEEYFQTKELQQIVFAPLKITDYLTKFKISIKVKGGGIVSQAEAVRHGIARSLILFDSSLRKKLKKQGYLKRDPRMRERKKFGLKRARRAPQWSKR